MEEFLINMFENWTKKGVKEGMRERHLGAQALGEEGEK